MLNTASKTTARKAARIGQAAGVLGVGFAAAMVVFGVPGLGPSPRLERPPAPPAVTEVVEQSEMPAVVERRVRSIANNLAQLGNAPKPAPKPETPEGTPGGEVAPVAPIAPVVAELPVTFLGAIGSGSRPMALVTIDARQLVLSRGEERQTAAGENVKLVEIGRDSIRVEARGVTKEIALAARTTGSFTPIGGPAAPSASPVPNSAPSVQAMEAPVRRRPNWQGRGAPDARPDVIGVPGQNPEGGGRP